MTILTVHFFFGNQLLEVTLRLIFNEYLLLSKVEVKLGYIITLKHSKA